MFNNIAESELDYILEKVRDESHTLVSRYKLDVKEVTPLFDAILFNKYQTMRQNKDEVYLFGNMKHIKRNEHKKFSLVSYLHSSSDSVWLYLNDTVELLVCRCAIDNKENMCLPLFVVHLGFLSPVHSYHL